jgi:hypothetical protein
VRASVAGLLAVLCFLAGFSFLTQRSIEEKSRQADRAMRISALYQDARDWVGEEQSEERRYRFEGAPASASPDAAATALCPRWRPPASSILRRPTAPPSLSCWTSMRVTATPAEAVRGRRRRRRSRYPAPDHEVIDLPGVLEDVVSRQADAGQATRAHSASVGPRRGASER